MSQQRKTMYLWCRPLGKTADRDGRAKVHERSVKGKTVSKRIHLGRRGGRVLFKMRPQTADGQRFMFRLWKLAAKRWVRSNMNAGTDAVTKTIGSGNPWGE